MTFQLDELPATFTLPEVIAAGGSRRAVYSWRDSGKVVQISRGVYRKADAAETAYLDVLAAARRAPRGVVCLVSALALHELTDEIPPAVQLAVPRGVNPPSITYPPVETHRFDAATFDIGKQLFDVAPGESVNVYSPERAIADAMRLRHLVGENVALAALRSYLAEKRGQPAELMNVARSLGRASVLADAMRVLLS
ncbi:type IV toxin-antitoxin system AbiEi family antitoxin domain-containing protein [Natronoglycomyces albus]|uniref:Type IV toxin-antitoxin system AbiEi family antitoxin domain-containing protein n=1 Tax=Natronoglycomyces albus TaxID=2811108 RepID=A0A895XQP1_9ACTN|nr:type IV toxin-antitoxin system AbiEi family antitoxin domain-containing protein [Natronoglycomyces albus]QSB06032.1 type IV toxin-antitoxin system AbiEi family antitoxin domain-containing protein [Natronoglycomyces albus]